MMAAVYTVRSLLRDAERMLGPDARLDAEVLLQAVLEKDRAWIYAHLEADVDASHASDFTRLVAARGTGYPVAYLTGRREFWSLPLAVSRDTLIPRPETELLVESALRLMDRRTGIRILDLGTGSGAIAIALAHECPEAHVVAVDISRAALEVAAANATGLGIGNVQFRHSDWFASLGNERFDVIVSNPPYVDSTDPLLTGSEIRFEPRLALDGGPGGLAAIGSIVAGAPRHAAPGAVLIIEHGAAQGADVRRLLENARFADVGTARDVAGHERVTFGRWT
jgi:release factor glutamine methyltransferase